MKDILETVVSKFNISGKCHVVMHASGKFVLLMIIFK
jgi:hypothetical protein